MERAAPGETGINMVNAFFHQDLERNPVTQSFTSNFNVRYLMEQLIASVQRATGRLIGPQPIQALAHLMKAHYLTSGPYLLHMPDVEVERLNRAVLQQAIHETTQAVQAYDRYLHDAFTQPVPPDRPLNTNIAGNRQFEINRFL